MKVLKLNTWDNRNQIRFVKCNKITKLQKINISGNMATTCLLRTHPSEHTQYPPRIISNIPDAFLWYSFGCCCSCRQSEKSHRTHTRRVFAEKPAPLIKSRGTSCFPHSNNQYCHCACLALVAWPSARSYVTQLTGALQNVLISNDVRRTKFRQDNIIQFLSEVKFFD